MAQEIERAFIVDRHHLPNLEGVPYASIQQTYFTPYPSDPRYPEVADGEWRVRTTFHHRGAGENEAVATVKFGDKASGSRTEIEASIGNIAFGTCDGDIGRYGQAEVQKQRFFLPDGSTLDHFDVRRHGKLWLLEKEFASQAEADAWQPPDYCSTTQVAPKNRELATPIGQRAMSHEAIIGKPWAQVLHEVNQERKRTGQVLVTISGFSGSGKTTLARQLAEEFDAPLISADDYHIGAKALEERTGSVNHDRPEAYDIAQAARDAQALANGQIIHVPQYDFATAEPRAEQRVIKPTSSRVVVLEGLYAYWAFGSHGQQATYRLFVNTPFYASVLRRLQRDVQVDGNDHDPNQRQISMSSEEALQYLHNVALPTYIKNCAATKPWFDNDNYTWFNAWVQSAKQ
ncbi:MAG TPA: AAA family ATPase [Candidatus Saccharimonadales bacterium]|nr:AAA family ATPase [Candidatus Saccharimonadales bacterium]